MGVMTHRSTRLSVKRDAIDSITENFQVHKQLWDKSLETNKRQR